MQRQGKTLKTLAPGDRRRLADARNAWRKMNRHQRHEFLEWMFQEDQGGDVLMPPGWRLEFRFSRSCRECAKPLPPGSDDSNCAAHDRINTRPGEHDGECAPCEGV